MGTEFKLIVILFFNINSHLLLAVWVAQLDLKGPYANKTQINHQFIIINYHYLKDKATLQLQKMPECHWLYLNLAFDNSCNGLLGFVFF